MNTNEPTLIDRVNEEEKQKGNETLAKIAGAMLTGGLVLSGVFTMIYLTIAMIDSLTLRGWSVLLATVISLLVGVSAIVPGEISVFVWKTKLLTDTTINKTQKVIAWIAGVAAVIAAAIATVSFFVYLLESFTPGWYDRGIAASVNIISIAVSWVIFGLALFAYDAASSNASTNEKRAQANNKITEADNDLITGVAQAKKDRVNQLVTNLDKRGFFNTDAAIMLSKHLKLGEERQAEIRRLTGSGRTPLPATSAEPGNEPSIIGFSGSQTHGLFINNGAEPVTIGDEGWCNGYANAFILNGAIQGSDDYEIRPIQRPSGD